jgi:hypothetical protein
MLFVETPKLSAIEMQVSPGPTVYSMGACSVAVGTGLGVKVSVAVGVTVVVLVGVTSGGGVAILPVARSPMNTIVAPTTKKSVNNPKAPGSDRVTSGMRLPWIIFCDLPSAVELNSVPQTRHRVALSLRRVPHVGQIFVFCVGVSGLIARRIIPSPVPVIMACACQTMSPYTELCCSSGTLRSAC